MRRSASGSGSVWVLAVCALVAAVAVGGAAVGAAVVARHRADAAADLAALAAAAADATAVDGAAHDGDAHQCAVARRIAQANGALLTRCAVDSVGTVTVTVAVQPAALVARMGVATATARAGRLPPVPAHQRQPER